MEQRTILLDDNQINNRINRIAYQLYEDHVDDSEIIIAGVVQNGFLLAEKLSAVLATICPIKITLCPITLEKHNRLNTDVKIPLSPDSLKEKSVVLVDDVLNSGQTLFHSIKPFLLTEVKKLRTVVLINRSHCKFPIKPDFVGLALATTLHEHVSVEFDGKKVTAWLS